MKRVIKLTKKPVQSVGPRKEKIVSILARLGARKQPIEFSTLKKACRNVDPRVLRAHVRELRDERVVFVRKAA
jgi:DNA-binding HxlR family transcriptional regulator